jgi:predicted AAA+ superfamily ATPase
LLSETPDPGFYREWLDSFFSRDVQGLFAFHAPEKFNALFEYLLRQSGGLFEVAKAASGLGISRPTKGWDTLRPEDCGVLWEHMVLEFLQARRPDEDIRYWRDKAGRELDFVLPYNRGRVDVLECKWNPQDFDSAALKAFRTLHPSGRNYVISPVAGDGFVRRLAGLEFTVCDPIAWAARARISS